MRRPGTEEPETSSDVDRAHRPDADLPPRKMSVATNAALVLEPRDDRDAVDRDAVPLDTDKERPPTAVERLGVDRGPVRPEHA